jgi:hypothetical protein
MAISDLKVTIAILATFRYDPSSSCVKLSRGLVLTSWGARPNCNLVLNYAGSPRRLLRQKLQDEKRISFSKSAKRPMRNIYRNRWRITQGTQLERRVFPLESRSYNKSHPSPKAYCSSKIDGWKPFIMFSNHLNPCLTFLSSVCISLTPAQVYSLVHIYLWATSLWIRKCLPITILL